MLYNAHCAEPTAEACHYDVSGEAEKADNEERNDANSPARASLVALYQTARHRGIVAAAGSG